MTSNGPPVNPYNGPVMNRGVFVALIVVWVLLVVFTIVVVIHHFRDHVPFGTTFWVGIASLLLLASTLIRADRLRRSAAWRR